MSFDLFILGSGYPGSLLATVAASSGFKVALLDRDSHPRFAIGESTTPEQNTVHTELAKAFDVPELAELASYERLIRATRAVPLWPKESFYFAQFDTPEAPPNEFLFQTTPWPIGPDYHCCRSAYDLHVLGLAVRRGVTLFAPASLEELELSDSGVSCTVAQDGTRISLGAKLFVDATGFGSALANRWKVAEIERRNVPLRSRSIYSHFLRVPRLEKVVARGPAASLALSRDHATAHLVFEGGWFWSIPFDNGITSVGVVVDCERHPLDEGLTPREEFQRFVDGLPAASRLLDGAVPVRDYVRTGQLQFSLGTPFGPGWVALPPASGSVDPLMSPGNALVAKSVGRLATVLGDLLATPRRADLLKEFADLQTLEWAYTNRLQQNLYRSFRHRALFRPTFTLYQMGSVLGAATGLGRETYRSPFHVPLWSFDLPEIRSAVDRFHELLPSPSDRTPVEVVARELNRVLEEADRWGYLSSPVHRSRRPNVHLINLAHARWIASLSPRGRRPWRQRWWWTALRLLKFWPPRSTASAFSRRTSGTPRVSRLRHLRIILSRVRR
jgi:FADH2 O2-dependent halogenase